jgi:hypothetical protein
MTVAQLIRGLKKYHPDTEVVQGGAVIKAMRIYDPLPDQRGHRLQVRLIREGEKRA